MASSSSKILMVIAIFAVVAPSILGREFWVGDDKGWTVNFDYQKWAEGKEFHVGDSLVFKYPEGKHNVLKVNGTQFQQCVAPPNSVALTSGNDVIELTTGGKKWYMCGVANHCASLNQKLVISVLAQVGSPALPPSENSAPSGIIASACSGLMVAIVGILGFIMI